jgi:hypothetical protein
LQALFLIIGYFFAVLTAPLYTILAHKIQKNGDIGGVLSSSRLWAGQSGLKELDFSIRNKIN